MVNAVLLAGTPANNEELINGKNKAFLELGAGSIYSKKKVIEYVVESLLEAKTINNTAIVGPAKNIEAFIDKYQDGRIKIVTESENPIGWKRMLENLLVGYNAVKNDGEKVLYLPADIPLVKGSHIDDFVQDCLTIEKVLGENDMYCGIIDNSLAKNSYKRHERRGIVTREGEFRLANIYLGNPEKIKNKEKIAMGFAHSRKLARVLSVLRLAYIIGPVELVNTAFRYYTQKISLGEIEKLVSAQLDAKFCLVKTNHASLEYDIDNDADLNNIADKIKIHKRDSSKKFKIS